ncbi:hypothetical protein, partial [Pseudomonas sp. NCHU5232]|uniref:hypothetical protein n=1 Tax=Pseudomonas sp. NCHU5232 TaxID=3451356 RepID=UPI003F9D5CC3
QPGPDDRAEGFGYFARKVTRPGGRNQKHQQKRGNAEQTPNKQQALTQTCSPVSHPAAPEKTKRRPALRGPSCSSGYQNL